MNSPICFVESFSIPLCCPLSPSTTPSLNSSLPSSTLRKPRLSVTQNQGCPPGVSQGRVCELSAREEAHRGTLSLPPAGRLPRSSGPRRPRGQSRAGRVSSAEERGVPRGGWSARTERRSQRGCRSKQPHATADVCPHWAASEQNHRGFKKENCFFRGSCQEALTNIGRAESPPCGKEAKKLSGGLRRFPTAYSSVPCTSPCSEG